MRTNEILKTLLIAIMSVLGCGGVFAQSDKPLQITNVELNGNGFLYDYPKEYQGYLTEYLKKYPDSGLQYTPQGSLGFLIFPSPFAIDIKVNMPVKVKYVLYTYKKTFSQDGKRNYLQGIGDCNLVTPITTQSQIDADLDKIYEFPSVMETVSGSEELPWDGYTDPQFTGQRYAVRGCVYIVAYNADTGEIIDTFVFDSLIYEIFSSPGIEYRIDQQKDANGNVVKETLSGTVIVAYPDDCPIKKMTALLTGDGCGFSLVPISAFNQGADAIVADINSRESGDVSAMLTLTNPTVDPDNSNIKIFEWKDIKTLDGKDFVPDLANQYWGYYLYLIIEMDDMTFTGVKNGFIAGGCNLIPPVPRGSITGIQNPTANDKIVVETTPNGFIIGQNGNYSGEWTLMSASGMKVATGKGNFVSTSGLPKGVYLLTFPNAEGIKETQKVIVR